jgi:hypothetical protein
MAVFLKRGLLLFWAAWLTVVCATNLLAELKAALKARRTGPWYRQIVGDYAGDEALREIARLGQRIRAGKLKS